MYSGPGANGSHWETLVWVSNFSAEPFTAPGLEFALADSCIINICLDTTIRARRSGELIHPRSPNGLLLNVPDGVLVTVKIAAAPSHPWSSGTELPVAREADFVRRPLRFALVPINDDHVRVTLRVYALDAVEETRVRVETLDGLSLERALAESVLSLPKPKQAVSAPQNPGFASALLSAANIEDLNPSEYFAVSVTPLPLPSGELPRIWAFLTITDNVTQSVTVQQPQ
jgi:hypothetical protein